MQLGEVQKQMLLDFETQHVLAVVEDAKKPEMTAGPVTVDIELD